MRYLLSLIFLTISVSAQSLDPSAYFPIRQGDAWTYDWQYRIGKPPPQTVKRTRAFEGREFVNTGNVDKLASENGDYALFSLNESGLWLHGAAEYERDVRFLFDPPVAVLTKTMKPGEPLKAEQLAEDGKMLRHFSSVYEVLPSYDTPMGRFQDCLKVTWTMEDGTAWHATTYFLARGVGVVGYAIEVKTKSAKPFEMSVDARLRIAQFAGKTFLKTEDFNHFAATKKSAPENSKARALFRKAHESQYTWDKKFPGFTAEFSYSRDSGAAVTGKLRVTRAYRIEIECADATVKAATHAELSQFVSYRQAKPFDELYATAQIGFGDINDLTTEIIVSDDTATGSSFLLRDREILRISRSYGRVRFVNQVTSLKTDDQRFIANQAELTFYSNETGTLVGQTKYTDRYDKIGTYWLPLERHKEEFAKGKASQAALVLRDVRYEK
ncbi:MAG: DUF3386 family protein [Acidobacteria bacterium]|nr:DUF3386 family protein [Acidobacteriota bacterium]